MNTQKILLTVTAGVCAALTTYTAEANPIQGTISFTGTFSDSATQIGPTLPSLFGAKYVTLITASVPSVGTGAPTLDYSPTAGKAAVFNTPISIGTPTSPGTGLPVNPGPLWTVTVGLDTFKFYATDDSTLNTGIVPNAPGRGSYTDTISGDGYAVETGPDAKSATDGTWTLNLGTSESKGKYSFSFGSTAETAATPDGGLTVSLLGGSLIALAGLRRKLGL